MKKNLPSKFVIFIHKWRDKHFSHKQKLKEFITTTLASQELLKSILHAEI